MIVYPHLVRRWRGTVRSPAAATAPSPTIPSPSYGHHVVASVEEFVRSCAARTPPAARPVAVFGTPTHRLMENTQSRYMLRDWELGRVFERHLHMMGRLGNSCRSPNGVGFGLWNPDMWSVS